MKRILGNKDSPQKAKRMLTSTSPPGRNSPDCCPICLQALENDSSPQNCIHKFCFDCLFKWSKIKRECPVCRNKYRQIINMKTGAIQEIPRKNYLPFEALQYMVLSPPGEDWDEFNQDYLNILAEVLCDPEELAIRQSMQNAAAPSSQPSYNEGRSTIPDRLSATYGMQSTPQSMQDVPMSPSLPFELSRPSTSTNQLQHLTDDLQSLERKDDEECQIVEVLGIPRNETTSETFDLPTGEGELNTFVTALPNNNIGNTFSSSEQLSTTEDDDEIIFVCEVKVDAPMSTY